MGGVAVSGTRPGWVDLHAIVRAVEFKINRDLCRSTARGSCAPSRRTHGFRSRRVCRLPPQLVLRLVAWLGRNPDGSVRTVVSGEGACSMVRGERDEAEGSVSASRWRFRGADGTHASSMRPSCSIDSMNASVGESGLLRTSWGGIRRRASSEPQPASENERTPADSQIYRGLSGRPYLPLFHKFANRGDGRRSAADSARFRGCSSRRRTSGGASEVDSPER